MRWLHITLLLVFLGVNSYSGVAKIMGFHHGYRGAKALSRAEVDLALDQLRKSVEWLPGESTHHVTIGRVVAMAQANGLPLAALDGRSPMEVLAVGAGAAARGVVLNPADAWAWHQLGTVYDGFGDARARLERMLEAGRAASGAPALTGEPPDIGVEGLDTEERLAAAAAMMARELEPEFFYYHDFLADIFWENGLGERAASEIRDSLALMPRVELHPLLEDEEFVRTMSAPILEGIERAASNPELSPRRAARARATILERLGRHGGAIEAWRKLARLGGEAHHGESDLAIGMIEQRRERYEQSIPPLERAAATGPAGLAGVASLYYLGRAHERLGDLRRAEEYYREYVQVRPSSLGGYLGLAGVLDRLGKTGEAERTYVDAVRRFPDSTLAYERVIRQMIRNGKEREAEPYAVALSKKDPGNRTALDLLGRLGSTAR